MAKVTQGEQLVNLIQEVARLRIALEPFVAQYDGRWLGDDADRANPDDYGSTITCGQVRFARAAVAAEEKE